MLQWQRPNKINVGWLCYSNIVWELIREMSSHAARQKMFYLSCLSSLWPKRVECHCAHKESVSDALNSITHVSKATSWKPRLGTAPETIWAQARQKGLSEPKFPIRLHGFVSTPLPPPLFLISLTFYICTVLLDLFAPVPTPASSKFCSISEWQKAIVLSLTLVLLSGTHCHCTLKML